MSLNFTQTTFYDTQRQGAIWIHLPWPTVLSSIEAMSFSTLHLGAKTKLLTSGSCSFCALLRKNAYMAHGRHICALTARHCPTPTGNGIASPFLVLLLRNRVSLCIPGYPGFPRYPGCHQTRSNPPPQPSQALVIVSINRNIQHLLVLFLLLLLNVVLGAEDRTHGFRRQALYQRV